MREWKNWQGQNCSAGKYRSGNSGTTLQGVEKCRSGIFGRTCVWKISIAVRFTRWTKKWPRVFCFSVYSRLQAHVCKAVCVNHSGPLHWYLAATVVFVVHVLKKLHNRGLCCPVCRSPIICCCVCFNQAEVLQVTLMTCRPTVGLLAYKSCSLKILL